MASAHPSVLTERPGVKRQGWSQENPSPRGRRLGQAPWRVGTEQPSGQEETEREKAAEACSSAEPGLPLDAQTSWGVGSGRFEVAAKKGRTGHRGPREEA